jgi:hypothetical protein
LDPPNAGYFWDGASGRWRGDLGPIANYANETTFGWEYDTSVINWNTGLNGGYGPYWNNGGTFRIRTEAADVAGNKEKNGVFSNLNYKDIVFDPTKPTSAFSNISDGDFKNSFPQIQGYADDRDASVGYTPIISSVKINIYDSINNRTYNGNLNPDLWTSGEQLGDSFWFDTNFVGVSSGVWTFNSPNWQHSISYRIVVKAKDLAGNFQTNLSTVNFVYDVYQPDPEKPNSLVNTPSNNSHYNYWFSTINGDSDDNVRGAINGVRLKIIRYPNPYLGENTTYYWNNTTQDWDSSDSELNRAYWPNSSASDGSFNSNYEPWQWSTPQSGVAAQNFWKPGRVYDVSSLAYDKAGNYEKVYSTITFVYEIDKPTVSISYPVNSGYITQTGKVSGTSVDSYPGIVEKVYVRIKRNSDNSYWDASSSNWTLTGI